jgi:hypothetical protein
VLQTPLLKNKESADVKVDELYGLEDWNASISEIMAQHNITTSRLFKEKRPAREYPSRFNTSAISRRTILHICRLLAVDYCCLNYKLPDICGDNDAAGVFCEERGFRIFPKTIAPNSWNMHLTSDFEASALQAGEQLQNAWRNNEDWELNSSGWQYALGVCPSEDWTCFFEAYPSRSPVPINELNLRVALEALLKPKDWLLRKARARIANINDPGECTVVSVMHSLESLPFPRYLESVNGKNIVLSTDDQDVVDEALKDTNHTYFFIDNNRFRGNHGGRESFPASDRNTEIMATILAEREVVKRCSRLVGRYSRYPYFLSMGFACESINNELASCVL